MFCKKGDITKNVTTSYGDIHCFRTGHGKYVLAMSNIRLNMKNIIVIMSNNTKEYSFLKKASELK